MKINMKRFHVLQYLMLAATIGSCEPGLKVSSDFDKNADFAQYRTFALYNSENINNTISQMNKSRIASAIKNEMIKKGYQEDAASPDLMVNATAIFKDKTAVSSSSTDYYANGSMYRPYTWGPGVAHSNYDVKHYKDGSLIIDIIEASSKKLLWQGTGNKEIDAPLKDPDTKIPKGIAAIMADFPSGKTKKQ
jgi:hypothetical protein